MLGRVFEGLMAPAERSESGTFFTPSRLVSAVVRATLAAWLSRRLRVSEERAASLLDSPDARTRDALARITVLDPAVGSGAFLLGALRLLAGPATTRAARRALLIRSVLSHGLFGVDRNAAAVRLAELRLWLEVVAADPGERPESIAPLPNLDALVRQGDSLIDPTGGLPLAGASASFAVAPAGVSVTGTLGLVPGEVLAGAPSDALVSLTNQGATPRWSSRYATVCCVNFSNSSSAILVFDSMGTSKVCIAYESRRGECGPSFCRSVRSLLPNG